MQMILGKRMLDAAVGENDACSSGSSSIANQASIALYSKSTSSTVFEFGDFFWFVTHW